MKVAKRESLPSRISTHFEWEPGMHRQASVAPARASAPSAWVSSPRMTSGAPARLSPLTPGTIQPPISGTGSRRAARAAPSAGSGA